MADGSPFVYTDYHVFQAAATVAFHAKKRYLCKKYTVMDTLIIKYDNSNKAIRQVLFGLKKMGAIVIEKSLYNDDFVKKIAKGEQDLHVGKGITVNPDELWK